MQRLIDTFQKKVQNTSTEFTRSIMNEIYWDAQLVGIKGSRGVGKTTLMLQYIKLHLADKMSETLYVSLDDLWFSNNSLDDLVIEFAQNGGKYLFLDEVHKYDGWSQLLKNFYDNYPELKIVFTGSSLLEILNARADLSRRAVVFTMQGLSYREYLSIEHGLTFKKYNLEELLSQAGAISSEVNEKIRPLQYFHTYLKSGFYPFYKEIPDLYLQRLQEVINFILEVELPQHRKFDIAFVSKIKQLLVVIAESVPFTPNTTKLSEKIQINRTTLLTYLNYLEEAGLTKNLYKDTFGVSALQKPNKIYLDNTNLMYLLSYNNTNVGNIRETFFLNQVSYQNKVNYTDKGDFLINNKFTFEIGGKNKENKQINGVSDAYLVKDNIEYSHQNTLPLWMFGFLY
jgi:uncharacterized protein